LPSLGTHRQSSLSLSLSSLCMWTSLGALSGSHVDISRSLPCVCDGWREQNSTVLSVPLSHRIGSKSSIEESSKAHLNQTVTSKHNTFNRGDHVLLLYLRLLLVRKDHRHTGLCWCCIHAYVSTVCVSVTCMCMCMCVCIYETYRR
jgi:hypothetical protein